MFSRIVVWDCKRQKIHDLRQILVNTVLPEMQRQPGFIDVIHATDLEAGRTIAMSLWKTREDADRYGKESFGRLTEPMRPFMEHEPTVHTMEVDISTVHKIAIGKAA